SIKSRTDCIAYAEKQNIPITATAEKPYSTDRNLFHISYEGGILEDPWREPTADMFLLTVDASKAPDKPRYLEIEFEAGVPVAIDGERLLPASLLTKLNTIADEHGVGQIDIVKNRFIGMKSRKMYKTPDNTVLHKAHRAVESLTMDRKIM